MLKKKKIVSQTPKTDIHVIMTAGSKKAQTDGVISSSALLTATDGPALLTVRVVSFLPPIHLLSLPLLKHVAL